jgi:hypothetical protein
LDRHALALDKDNCLSYETYLTYWKGDHYECGSGAVFDLRSNKLRPDTWTSATASGLPIIAGMVRNHEVALEGAPMGLRVRLRADYDLSRFHGAARTILLGLRKYGMMDQLKTVPGSAFEVIQLPPLRH